MSEKKNIWIFAGETSGDVYGAELAKSLIKIYSGNVSISGMGGKAMKDAGVNIIIDSTELGVVGLIEVLKSIFKFISIFKFLVRKAEEERPDAVILIDYPGFNLRFAKQMHKRNIKVIWYVSPQIWAWGKKRIYKLAEYCAKMLVIFPFEVEYYREKTNLDVEFVGHPLVDIVKHKLDPDIKRDMDKLLILPGSRFSEINRVLVPLLETALLIKKKHPHLKLKISAARPSIEKRIREISEQFIADRKIELPFEIECGNNLKLLQECGTGLSKSGTVTVEATIVGIPLVVYYKLNPITYIIAKMIITLFRNSFVMPNIIANKTIYEEFQQNNGTPKALAEAIERILPGGERREYVISELDNLTDNMLTYGKHQASDNAAEAVQRTLA